MKEQVDDHNTEELERQKAQMRRCFDKFGYPMDKEVIELCKAMNSIYGVETISSCSGHGKGPLQIWFRATEVKGLFFLGRCICDRYWAYGSNWRIEVEIGDSAINGTPVVYLLTTVNQHGEEAYKQADDLIENMKYHRNHEAFMEYYGLNKDNIKLEE